MNPRIPDPQASPPTCAQCKRAIADGLYDDRAEHYYCDEACFHDWADENFEEVADFYRRMNVD